MRAGSIGRLGDDVFGRNKIDIVNAPHLLQLHIPLGEFLGRKVEAIALVGNVEVLAKHAPQVAAREEDAP